MNFSSSQKEQLEVYANLCPQIGGRAVYRARSLYGLIAQVHYDDISLCEEYQGFEGLSSQSIEDSSVKMKNDSDKNHIVIFPNPANQQLTIQYDLSSKIIEANIEIRIVDMYGKVVFNEIVNSFNGQKIVALYSLPSGVYQIIINADEKVIHNERIVVAK